MRIHHSSFASFSLYIAGAIAAALMLASCGSLSARAPRVAGLTGDWKLDPALSDDPRGVLRQQRQSGHGAGLHRHGGGPGMPGSGGLPGDEGQRTPSGAGGTYGGHGNGRPGGGFHGGTSVLADFEVQPTSVRIKESPTQLALDADGVSTEFVYGEKVMASVLGGTAERVSGWKGRAFVVKYNVSDGPVATRTYETLDGGKQLVVTTHVAGGRERTLDFKTVYDRASIG